MAKESNLNEDLKKLADIVKWFDQSEVDVEMGLNKVKEGALLVRSCRARLKTIENQFEEIQKDLDDALSDK